MDIPQVKPEDVQGTPRTGQYSQFGPAPARWWAAGTGWIGEAATATVSGYASTTYSNGQADEAEAIAKWRQGVANAINSAAERKAIREQFGQQAKNVASRRLPLNTYGFNRGQPETGEVVKVWGFGGYRLAIVVEPIGKARAKVVWVTPNNPDLHIQTLGLGKIARDSHHAG